MNLEEAKGIVVKALKKDSDELDLNSYSDDEKLSDEDLLKLLPDIFKLKSLQTLDLSYNQISDTSFLTELRSLTKLSLGSNQISDGSFAKELKSLTGLSLGGNQISEVLFLSELKSLEWLDISGNRISDTSFLKELVSLTWLDTSSNEISDVSSFKELRSLKRLDLSHNKIRDASFLKELKSLTTLFLGRNPNLDLPKNLKDKFFLEQEDINEIIKYYAQLEKEGEDHIYEAKVLIVGEPNAGKTTLFRKLLDPMYLPKDATAEQKEQTVGVNIKFLSFPFDNEREFKAHLWDFGGHEKQYVLHQYFFTERSLYVLLTDDRKEDANFNYWFEIIATLGSNCPVLVVLNEINSKVPNIDISLYRKRLPRRSKTLRK